MTLLGPVLLTLATWTAIADASLPARTIADFALPDQHGNMHRLNDWRQSKLIVVVFIGVECPLAELYAPRLASLASQFQSRGVVLLAIDSNKHDSVAEIARYAESHHLSFPILKDAGQIVADRFGAMRTREAFVLDEQSVLR